MSSFSTPFVLLGSVVFSVAFCVRTAAKPPADRAPRPTLTSSRHPSAGAETPGPVKPIDGVEHFDPATAWTELGCVGCHGDDGVYRDEVKGALGKPVDQVARWIRNAPSIKPGTEMPCFEARIDTPRSEALAAWVLDRAAHLD